MKAVDSSVGMGAAETLYVAEETSDQLGDRSFSISLLLGRLAFYGLLIVVVLAAFPNGTVEVWHKAAVISAIAVVGLIRIVSGLGQGTFRISEHGLIAPPVCVVLIAAVQCIPFTVTASVDPYETRGFILVFGSLIVCGEVLFTYTTSVSCLRTLVILVIMVATGSSLFGFLWELLAGSDYNIFALYVRPHQGYAQFINRNHFALLVEMGVGLLIGLLLRARLNEAQRFFGWVLAGGLIYSLIAASSRGGLVSLVGLAVFAVFLHVFTGGRNEIVPHGANQTRRRFAPLNRFAAAFGICVLVVSLIAFLAAFVGGDQLASRFEKADAEVAAIDSTRTNRHLIWASTIDLIAARPLLGVGFGAYEAAITNYDRSNGTTALKQAHNEYLEILSNGGVIGTVPFLALAVLVFARTKRNLASADPVRSAYTFGAAVGIFGVLVHSLVDFGLHVLVNALLFVVMIVIATAEIAHPQRRREPSFIRRSIG